MAGRPRPFLPQADRPRRRRSVRSGLGRLARPARNPGAPSGNRKTFASPPPFLFVRQVHRCPSAPFSRPSPAWPPWPCWPPAAPRPSRKPPRRPPRSPSPPVAFKELRQWDDFTGRLEAVDTVDIRPRVSGYVDGARFEEGARVRKGQVLFQIDPRPYQAEANRAGRGGPRQGPAGPGRRQPRARPPADRAERPGPERVRPPVGRRKGRPGQSRRRQRRLPDRPPEPGMDPRGLADRRPGLQGRDHPRQPGHPGRPADHGGVRHPDLRRPSTPTSRPS
jgi:hypothetical protein